jgi:hypothetical protein
VATFAGGVQTAKACGGGYTTGQYTAVGSTSHLPIRPYSATQRISDPKTGRELAVITTFVRADGSMAQTASDAQLKLIWDVTNRTETTVDLIARRILKAPLVSRRLGQMNAKSASCSDYFSRGNPTVQVTCTETGKQMFNRAVIKVENRWTFGTSPSRTEILHVIKELGWLVVKKEQCDHSGNLSSISEVISVTEGEPPVAEFSVPSGFTETGTLAAYKQAEAAARGQAVSQEELAQINKKWDTVISEANREGDYRFGKAAH